MQQVIVADPYELPQELRAKPLALVGLSGLDTLNNAIHKAVWDTFTSNRRTERAHVLFKLIDNAHEFPIVKPKRNSYEWYIPKGVLKKNWMNKHLNEVPAVIAIFYDLDWNDPQWNEKMIECASRVQSMRAALDGRSTRVVVVLIQSLAMPAGEDMIASEKATALCASCELNAKSLLVLPHVDHLQGYAVRLENAFYDLAQNYYHVQARNIKSHREHLNKTTHQYLFVRHQFKMGFLNELKQDAHTAHKHYTHAYNNLLEIRIVDTNANEIRTVAGYINYKLCRLMFTLNLPRDAISQFRAHVDRFKVRIGFKELAFEHYAWLSKQYTTFGDIFDEAVKLGLPAVQTQHPGLYYQQAAQFSILRRQSCQELCVHVTIYPSPDPLQGTNNLEFYGQRPWRPGKLSAEPPDPHLEQNGIMALQYLERHVNHSNTIIASYSLAITHYKSYRCPRTRRHLIVLMAEEYFNAKDYARALTLFTLMLSDYRIEKWWNIISSIISKAIKSAYLTANLQDFVILSLEALGKHIDIPVDDKKKIYENLCNVLQRQLPEPDKDLPSLCVQNAISLWQQSLTSQTQQFILEMGTMASCIDCKGKFVKTEYQADENITIEVYLKSLCLFPLTVSRTSVTVNAATYSSEYIVDSDTVTVLNSNEIIKLPLAFKPNPKDVDKGIQISTVSVQIGGKANDCIIILKFSGLGNDSNSIQPELQHFRNCSRNMPDFDNIKPQLTANIVPRQSKLEVLFEHANPALVNEWYEINVKIMNKELYGIKDVHFEISLVDDDGIDSTEFSLGTHFRTEKLPLQVKFDKLATSEEKSFKFFMRAHKIGERTLSCKASFILEAENPIASIKTESIIVSIVKPFDITTKYMSMLFEDINKFYVGEEFVIMPIVNCLSPWPIIIENSSLDFLPQEKYLQTFPGAVHDARVCRSLFEYCIQSSMHDFAVQNADKTITSQLKGITLNHKENGSEIYLANTSKQSDKPVDIGQYTVKWKRLNGFSTKTEVPIQGLTIDWIPLDIKISLPEHGYVRTPLLVQYHFMNKSFQLIQLDINMEGSEAFMFAGYKQFQIHILPGCEKIIDYNLYPLIPGSVAIPKLLLSIPDSGTEGPALRQDHLQALIDRALPKYLFVMPQVKGNPKMDSRILNDIVVN